MSLIDRWNSFLITASDSRFFQIMRTYLGDVKTPFNKHDLIDRLNALLRKQETIDRIIELLDTKDARVLTGVDVLGEPTIGKLFSLFEGSTPYLKLHYHVLNLEERLLVFRESGESGERILLNPLFIDELHSRVLHAGLIFPAYEGERVERRLSFPSDARLLAVTAYLSDSGMVLKNDGTFRKKAATEAKRTFAEDSDSGVEGILAVTQAFESLGAFTEDDGRFAVSLPRWRELCALDGESRRAYLGAAAAADEHGNVSREVASSVRSALRCLPYTTAVEDETLERLIRVQSEREMSEDAPQKIVARLLGIGILARTRNGNLIRVDPGDQESRQHRVIVQPTFELTVPFDVSADEAWFVPIIAELAAFDTVSTYEITRTACARAFGAGLDTEEIVTLLGELTESKVPKNIETSIGLWEQEYRAIRMFKGTVVAADENQRHLFEYDEGIGELIAETLAPGVYLLRSRDMERLRELLEQAGVEPVPAPMSVDAPRDADSGPAPLKVLSQDANFPPIEAGGTVRDSASFNATTYRESVAGFVGDDELSKEQTAELEDRLSRRLILFPNQVRDLQPTNEIIEAKGFDYLGKVRLIEQALANGYDLLEVIMVDSDGESGTETIKPDLLEKEGNDVVLVGRTLADESEVRLKVRSIGLIRRKRGSLFV